MEIRVYSQYLKFLGTIEDHTSVIWTRRYYEPGEFELHAPITEKNLRLLQPGNLITKKGSDEAGLIDDVHTEESNIKNEVIRRGLFLTNYFSSRLIKSTFNFNGPVEVAMRQLIQSVEPIPLLELGELNGFTETVEFQATMKDLLVYLKKLSRASTIGFHIRPDFKKKKLIFETYKGKDKTLSQGVNSRVIFSEKYENLNNAIYTYNSRNEKTIAIVGGKGEGAERIYITVGDTNITGYDRKEIFVDAKEISDENISHAEYLNLLRQKGLEALNQHIISEAVESETEPNINFVYKENYDLGDIVTVKKRAWDIAFNQRLTEIKEVYEYGGMKVVPTMGDALPEKIDWSE
ncbi:siphovirus ReqiPepy6 Gp37-like family protein [Lachnospiraceae bacterium OttesenSCG-928-J05]|nr:siphovirus ReqiPepy6 Gp37-like family protein [Lachnospiraceae bacterium OttesenSCG-928-J05]